MVIRMFTMLNKMESRSTALVISKFYCYLFNPFPLKYGQKGNQPLTVTLVEIGVSSCLMSEKVLTWIQVYNR